VPEYRKSSHGEAFPLDELMDIQIASWSTTNWPNRPPFNSKPPPVTRRQPAQQPTQERAAGRVRPELEDLERAAPPEDDDIRAAFRRWLEASDFHCERCDKRVQGASLKVPPPTGDPPMFHMYCSEECLRG
jgi:hypothetical protein